MLNKALSVLGLATLALSGCQSPDFLPDQPSIDNTKPPELGAEIRTDNLTQLVEPKVDVLWIMDNSCSMSEEQLSIAENFEAFISYFLDSGLDWHIGVVSTDTDGGEGGVLTRVNGNRYITSDTANPTAVFEDMIVLGTSGSATEKGLQAGYMAIAVKGNQQNVGFYRDEANLSMIAISDENDQSTTPPLPEFISWLRNLKAEEEMVSFSAIVGDRPSGCNGPGGNASSGAKYHQVVDAIGGISFSICEEDWSQVLTELGLQAASLQSEFFLSEIPVPGTIQVIVSFEHDPDRFPGEFTVYEFYENPDNPRFKFVYDSKRNSIVLENYVPPAMANVEVTYEVLADSDDPDRGVNVPGIDSGLGTP